MATAERLSEEGGRHKVRVIGWCAPTATSLGDHGAHSARGVRPHTHAWHIFRLGAPEQWRVAPHLRRYHSHPHITVLPSHVDLKTQAAYQMLDDGFVGIIISAFSGVRAPLGLMTCMHAMTLCPSDPPWRSPSAACMAVPPVHEFPASACAPGHVPASFRFEGSWACMHARAGERGRRAADPDDGVPVAAAGGSAAGDAVAAAFHRRPRLRHGQSAGCLARRHARALSAALPAPCRHPRAFNACARDTA